MRSFVVVLSIILQGEDLESKIPTPELTREQQKKWDEHYRNEAASYSISFGDDESKPLKMQPDPVLHWSNPVRGNDTRGSVFVWTHDGRPEVVGTVFSYRSGPEFRKTKHSFHSLSLGPISARRDGMDSWSITIPGFTPAMISDAPVPARSRALRLAQMRDIAREFSATTTLNGVEQELRLLTQPLYRYEQSSEDVVDGGLFTFVTGTDPELMLVIEARGTEDRSVWHFGAGRFTDLELKLTRNRKVIWNYEEGLTEAENTPYLSRYMDIRKKELP